MVAPLDPRLTTDLEFDRVSPEVLTAAAGLPTATLHEAGGRIGALPSVIKPVGRGMTVCGPAFTVQSPGGDNLWLHRAILAARPGDVLVVHVSGAYEYGYWGEIMATAAKVRGIAGLVIDGGVRDGVLLEEIGFPVFSRPLCIRGTGKDFGARGFIGHPLLFGDILIAPGDLIVGDGDGVVVVPRARAADVVAASLEREVKEAAILKRLEAGETTMDIYGFNL